MSGEGTYEVPIPLAYLPLRANVTRMVDQESEQFQIIYPEVPCRRGKEGGGLLLNRDQVSGAQDIEDFVFPFLFNGVPLEILPEDRLDVWDVKYPDLRGEYRVTQVNHTESARHHFTLSTEHWDSAIEDYE